MKFTPKQFFVYTDDMKSSQFLFFKFFWFIQRLANNQRYIFFLYDQNEDLAVTITKKVSIEIVWPNHLSLV